MPNKVELPSKNNIGLLRYILASGVIAGHYYVLSGRELSPLIQLSDLVGGFFAISGFLIYKSYKSRNSLAAYISGISAVSPPFKTQPAWTQPSATPETIEAIFSG